MPYIDSIENTKIETIDECPWCNSNDKKHLFTENGFPYVQCMRCSLIYLRKRIRESNIHEIYDDLSYSGGIDRTWALENARKRFILLNIRGGKKRIHEDAAGIGAFVRTCQDHGHEISGSDIGLHSIINAKKYFGVDVKHGTLAQAGIDMHCLDILASFNLLSHLYHPFDYMKLAHSLLKKDGRWIIRTGDRTGIMKYLFRGSWGAPEHVHHYNRKLLGRMLDEAGFAILKIQPSMDSEFPYFLYSFCIQGNFFYHKIARLICGYSGLLWTALRLPKDDVYIIATPHGN